MKYTIIDIETTGLKYQDGAEVTEIAGINVVDGEIITAYSSLVNIDKRIYEMLLKRGLERGII
jgi:DNA polymerase III epsilon subunit-like protein